MKKISRKALILTFASALILLLCVGLFFIKDSLFENHDHAEYSISVVAENKKLTSVYIDAISNAKSDEKYTENFIEIKAGTQILDYIISSDHSFSKYFQLSGPNGKDVLTKKSNQVITHYAYSMLLTGDIIEKTNLDTNEKTYEIVNARITYDRIPLVLLSNQNSVCLRDKNMSKEKIVNLQDFIDALKDVDKRTEMINWS